MSIPAFTRKYLHCHVAALFKPLRCAKPPNIVTLNSGSHIEKGRLLWKIDTGQIICPQKFELYNNYSASHQNMDVVEHVTYTFIVAPLVRNFLRQWSSRMSYRIYNSQFGILVWFSRASWFRLRNDHWWQSEWADWSALTHWNRIPNK